MAAAFEDNADEVLEERLLRVLEAGRDAGGQQAADGRHLAERSATVIVHGHRDYGHIDLRVDAHETAVEELRRVYGVYEPYMPYYQMRHENPAETPAQDVWARENL